MNLRPSIVALVLMLALILGLFLADLMSPGLKINLVICCSILLILLLLSYIFRSKLILLVAVSATLFVASFAYGVWQNGRFVPPQDFQNQTRIEGMIVDRPQLDDKQKIVVGVDGYKVLVNLPRYPEFSYGQVVKISGKLETPTIFPDFNYQNYLRGKQIYFVINKANRVEATGESGNKIKTWLYSVATRFENALNVSFTEPESSFAAGLITGSKRGLPDSFISAMQNTGTSHLVAISGYNITVIIVALSYLFIFLGRKWRFVATLLIIIGFVVLTGASASVVRGGIVGLLALFGKTIGRRANQTNIMLLAALLLLIFNPLMLLFDYGFLLSFAAFAGLIYLSPLLGYWFSKKKLLSRLPKIISGPLVETLSAQFMTLPILLFAFGKLSLVAPLTNPLILPMVPLAMFLAFLPGIFGMFAASLGRILGYVAWPFLTYPIKVINLFDKVPFRAVDFGKDVYIILPVSYLLISFIIYRNRRFLKFHEAFN